MSKYRGARKGVGAGAKAADDEGCAHYELGGGARLLFLYLEQN